MTDLLWPNHLPLTPPSGDAYARVAVERGAEHSGRPDGFTYRVPPELLAEALPGRRVYVPLGKTDKPAPGVIIARGGPELLDGFSPARVKSILRCERAHIPAPLMELARWMAAYYVCPIGMVMSTVVPAAVKHGTGTRLNTLVEKSSGPPPDDIAPRDRETLARLAAISDDFWPSTPGDLALELGFKSTGPVQRLLKLGLLRPVTVNSIEARGAGASPLPFTAPHRPPPDPTADQQCIIDGITPSLSTFSIHLVRGVTGSGKTEIYLRLIERVLESGRSALILVPEIALTPQTSDRFRRRFEHHGVAVLHSGLSASARHAAWADAASGKARVVVGARSAVFAPLTNLGFIVVDEEHDSSYKQDQLPRYNARDAAIKRAQIENCPVLLGSATPSLESWANATGENPRYRLWELPDRVGGGVLPDVRIVNLADEYRAATRSDSTLASIGPTLRTALAQTLDAEQQAILLLNRRGYMSYLSCANPRCGWLLGCEQCDTSMVLHRGRALPKGSLVRCHHCLAEQLLPDACPLCKSRLTTFGAGTQQVEEELIRLFGHSHGLRSGDTLLRIDSDTMTNAAAYFESLSRFARGEARVLLGTQMIAKGHDFPNVTLVGVINADTALNLPDFRAAERTFQLVSQVAGRAGRGTAPGRVIVQTNSPKNPAIRFAAAHDFTSFATQELADRRRSGLPPVTRMARIVCRDRTPERAEAAAARIADLIRSLAGSAVRIHGPAPCPIARVSNQWRCAVELTAPGAGELQRLLQSARTQGALKADAHTAVDVDPLSLM